ncbi:phosphotransferase, partial [Brachybacterium alimentarium]|uniref:phosphotransferase n=1 Tax=Brachybacterium alimentarium TaxID=47845 RepID=UPI003FD417D8
VGSRHVRKQFTSWQDGEADREWTCLTLLDEYAPGLAPRPLERTTEDDAPVIIMERLPGTPIGSAPLSVEQHNCLGVSLRRLYDVPLDAILRADLKERRLGPNALGQHLHEAYQQVGDLSRCTDPAAVEEAVLWGRNFLDRIRGGPEEVLPVMGIADLNPANVLWDGTACRLVDFEDGGRTKREFDLADHVEHIAARPRRVYDANLLSRAVGFTDAELRSFSDYRKLWALFWLHALLPENSAYLRNPRGTTESQAHYVLGLAADGAADM